MANKYFKYLFKNWIFLTFLKYHYFNVIKMVKLKKLISQLYKLIIKPYEIQLLIKK